MQGGGKKTMEYLPGWKPAGPTLTRGPAEKPLLKLSDLDQPTGPQPLARIDIARVPADQANRPLPAQMPKASPARKRRRPVPARAGGKPLDDSGKNPIAAGMAIMVLFFGVLGTWAAVAPLAGSTVAPGVLVVEGNRKAVQHSEGGTVRKILVRDGDKVQAGQTLVELDDNLPRTNVTVLSQQHDAFRTQAARLSAELEHADEVTFPKDILARMSDPAVAQSVNGQRQLFSARSAAFIAQIGGLNKRISELQEQIRGNRAQGQSRASQRRSVQSEMDSLGPLVEKGIVTRARALELERSTQRLEGEELELNSKVALDGQSIEQTKRQITQVESERITSTAAELRDTQNKDNDVLQHLQAAQETLKLAQIRAPASGSVLGLTVFGPGAVIARGEKIMEIVPDDKAMVVEASIKVDDIVYVHVGMKAEIRLTAFKARLVPTIDGTVTQVAADRITDSHSGTSQYPIKVQINEETLRQYPDISLVPGMSVAVYIPTGNRTALDYLMAPLKDSISAAFREQ